MKRPNLRVAKRLSWQRSSSKQTHITLSGEPKSTQHIYRSNCRGGYSSIYMTAEGKALKQQYQYEAKTQWTGAPFAQLVSVAITFHYKTRRRRDLDNQNKLILDALTGIAYDDDSQIAELHLTRAYDVRNPRIEVEIYPILAV